MSNSLSVSYLSLQIDPSFTHHSGRPRPDDNCSRFAHFLDVGLLPSTTLTQPDSWTVSCFKGACAPSSIG